MRINKYRPEQDISRCRLVKRDSSKMFSARILAICVLAVLAIASANEEAPKVRTPLGAIKGYHKVSANGRLYEAFEGIPYAQPPIGKLRFKPPHRIHPWAGELTATKFGSECLQYNQSPANPNDKVEGSEDCLYMNIYVPVREGTGGARIPPMPVIFWIHGGAFQFGSGAVTGPKFLMDHDVIVVTFNYRLGILGFLSTEDEFLPGNMGLKDQNMALRWVSENIEWFGGDPNQVTLIGLSAGGASVHYQYLSPLSAGLFQRGISISGTALDCWTQADNALEKAKHLGALMGCPTTSTKEMVQCLRYRPGRALIQATEEFMAFYYNPFTPFGPVVEKIGDAPFINQSPAEIISGGGAADVPWITSVTSEEGLYPVAEFVNRDEALQMLNENWNLLAPHFLDFNYTVPKAKHAEVAELIRKHYFDTKPIDRQSVQALIKLAGDRFFVVDGEKAARMQAAINTEPVWFYRYTYRGADSLSDALGGTKTNYGTSHADDAFIVMDTPFLDPTTNQNDMKMQQHLMEMWVSFATKGVPEVAGVEWPPLDPVQKELNYLHIEAPDKIYMDTCQNLGDKDFWKTILFNENRVSPMSNARKQEL